MNKFAITALAITALDAMGIGLIMPVLPALLREYVSAENLANHYGILLALYAIMQVFFAPILGKLSDKLGRRPILLLSLAGAAVDYTLLALSSTLWMLYLGRLISGLTGATGAVAASVIADNTESHERTKWFGRLGAAFGVGLIAGPTIGGFAGEYSPHLPFIIAAILNAGAFIGTFLIFKDRKAQREQENAYSTPTISNSFIQVMKPIILLIFVFFMAQLIGQIPATTWVLFTENRFQWGSMEVGLSLAGLGVMHALFQAFVAGAVAKKFSEKTTILLGFMVDGCAFLILSLLTQGWMIYPTLILLAGGSIALPALQGLISTQVSQENQGKLQGVLVSLTNATGVVGPLLFSYIYGQTLSFWDGWVWLIGALMYLFLIIAYFLFQQKVTSRTKKAILSTD